MCGRVSRPVQVFSPTIARAGRLWRAVPTRSIAEFVAFWVFKIRDVEWQQD